MAATVCRRDTHNSLELLQRRHDVVVVSMRIGCFLEQLLQQQHITRHALHRHDQKCTNRTRLGLFRLAQLLNVRLKAMDKETGRDQECVRGEGVGRAG